MGVFEMVVIIVAMSLAASAYSETLKVRRKTDARINALNASLDEGQNVVDELRALRQRVAALEKIVTDPRHQLQRDFEELERSSVS